MSGNEKELAQAVSEFLDSHGQEAIKNMRREDSQGEQFYKTASELLAQGFQQLSQLIDMTMNERSSLVAHDLLAKTMLRAWTLGTAAVVTPEVKQEIAVLRAANMREARSATPQETAIREAVVAEHGTGPAPNPSKEAVAILSAVNRRLTEAGFQPVKVGVVYLRLKKFPRS